jgi:acyl carrier protein
VARDIRGDKKLVAFVVGQAAPDALRAGLRSALPEYMVPSLFVAMSALPRTPNQKIDRNALVVEDDAALPAATAYTAPASENERRVAEAFESVLGVRPVGRDHNFFELGGHSLLIAKVVARIRERSGLELPVRAIFEWPTVAALAHYVDMVEWTAQKPAEDPDTTGGDRLRITI